MWFPAMVLSFCSSPCFLHYEGTDKHSAKLYQNSSAALNSFRKDAKLYQPLGLYLRAWIYQAEDMGLGILQPTTEVFRELSFLGNGKVACYRLSKAPAFSWPISKPKILPKWAILRGEPIKEEYK